VKTVRPDEVDRNDPNINVVEIPQEGKIPWKDQVIGKLLPSLCLNFLVNRFRYRSCQEHPGNGQQLLIVVFLATLTDCINLGDR
jgi:hypothetical protein